MKKKEKWQYVPYKREFWKPYIIFSILFGIVWLIASMLFPLIDLTTLDDYRVILKVILSLGPSLTQKSLIHPKFECSPEWS
jgi:hypothetical protein